MRVCFEVNASQQEIRTATPKMSYSWVSEIRTSVEEHGRLAFSSGVLGSAITSVRQIWSILLLCGRNLDEITTSILCSGDSCAFTQDPG